MAQEPNEAAPAEGGATKGSSSEVPGRILVVCHANVCRSVLIAGVIRSELARTAWADVQVVSAGTGAQVGMRGCEEASEILADRYGVHSGPHRSQAATLSRITAADLVLTAERAQRAAVVASSPLASSKAFTLREAEALLGTLDADAVRSSDVLQRPDRSSLVTLRALAASRRGYARYPETQRSLWSRLVPGAAARTTPQHPMDIFDGHNATPRRHAETLATAEAAAVAFVRQLERLGLPVR